MNEESLLAELAKLKARLNKLEKTDKQAELMPGFSYVIGTEFSGKVYRNINAAVKAVCELVRETGKGQVLSTWHIGATPTYNSFQVLMSVALSEPIMVIARTISVKESEAYHTGEANLLLRRAQYDVKAYRYKRTISRLNKDGSSKNFMRVRGR